MAIAEDLNRIFRELDECERRLDELRGREDVDPQSLTELRRRLEGEA